MNILITGGGGFIGINLLMSLVKEPFTSIVVVDNQFTSNTNVSNDKISYINCDISELDEQFLSKFEKLIHLAAIKKHNIDLIGEDDLFFTNFINTRKLFYKAASAGVSHIIFTSSLYANGNMFKLRVSEDEFPNPLTLYGQSKLFAENVLREISSLFEINITILRLYFIYGPHQYSGKGYPSVFIKTLELLQNNKPPILINGGTQQLDYLYVSDLIDLFLINIKQPIQGFHIFNASSGRAYPIKYVIDTLANIWNSEYKTNFIPEDNGDTDFTNKTYRSGDNSKAQTTFNWQPKVDMLEGISKITKWYLNDKY